jgi:TonB family protein
MKTTLVKNSRPELKYTFKLLLPLALFLMSNVAFAQKDTIIYYMTEYGQQVTSKDKSDYYVKIYPSDSLTTVQLYAVNGFYKDGARLFKTYSVTATPQFKPEGFYTTFFRSGKTMSIKQVKNGELSGTAVSYYPNGRFYNKVTAKLMPTDTDIMLEESRDSTGKVLTTKGNGYWITYDEGFTRPIARGYVKNFKQDSVWLMTPDTFGGFTIGYKDGKPVGNLPTPGQKIFTSVDEVPEFPGGIEAFYMFIAKNTRYPATAREQNIHGRIIVSFVVERDGSLSDVHVTRGIGGGCDEEAVRVIKLSPFWKPGAAQGKPVRVQYSVPITFTLENNGQTERIGREK